MPVKKRLEDAYRFPGFKPSRWVRGMFGEHRARIMVLQREQKKQLAVFAGKSTGHLIGIDEISVKKGQDYRIVVSDLLRRRAIWFGGKDRREPSMDLFYKELGAKKSRRIRLAVMDTCMLPEM